MPVEGWTITVLIGFAIVIAGIVLLTQQPFDLKAGGDTWIGISAIIGGGALSAVSLYSKSQGHK